jgi:hypothetical protein
MSSDESLAPPGPSAGVAPDLCARSGSHPFISPADRLELIVDSCLEIN